MPALPATSAKVAACPKPAAGRVLRAGRGRKRAVNWSTLDSYARAGGAFPLGFPAVGLRRPREHYDYRVAVVPGEDGKVKAVPLRPNWPDSGDDDSNEYAFLAVDGGTFNNELIELARTFLIGVTGRNPRDGVKAKRGVLLIDPLPGTAQPGPDRFESLVKLGGAMLSSLVNQGRHATADLLLMANPDVFSRYLAIPQRRVVISKKKRLIKGEKALATAGLGFFEDEYRRHDYMLGRANCHTYLAKKFVLNEANRIFECWTDKQKPEFRGKAGAGFLPLIPLAGPAREPDGPMPWPRRKLTARQIRKRLEDRPEIIVEKVADDAFDF